GLHEKLQGALGLEVLALAS
ncbi:hypothetical protein A2U01_0087793, partial [Trifolium medium]|nr:hypothetical protein [Trifolium medium]